MSRLAALLVLFPAPLLAADPVVLDLWPGQPPGETGAVGPETEQEPSKPGQRPVKRITNVTKPTLSVFRPAKEKDTGAAVIVAPGGGYNILAWDLEGEEVAAWLNSVGVTGIVLKYRVPRRPGQPKDQPPTVARMDAQRAVRVVRSKAADWGIDPNRLGMLGFSAGGHLTVWNATNPDKPAYEPVDAADTLSARPDFLVLVYPGYLVKTDKKDEFTDGVNWTKDSPPTFFAHAYDDPVSPENSVRSFLALKQLKVPAELHVYSTGGHGFGLRKEGKPSGSWPDRCGEWLATQGFLKK
jgi:acetyl esterase/lipase